MFLHAAELEFDHPATGRALKLSSALPPELETFLHAVESRHKR
jgi:hypothetical protein